MAMLLLQRIRFRLFLFVLFAGATLGSVPASAQLQKALHYLKLTDSLLFIHSDSAQMFAERLIQSAQAIDNDTLVGYAYGNLGVLEAVRGNYSTSLPHFLNALKLFEKHNLLKKQSAIVSNIAGVIMTQQRYREALTYLKRSLELDSLLQMDAGIASTYQNMSVVYRRLDMPDSALYFLNRALNKAMAVNDEQVIASSKYNIAYIYTQQGRYHEARTLLDDASAWFEQRQDLRGILSGALYGAVLEVKSGNFKQAIGLAGNGLVRAKHQNLDELRSSFLQVLAEAHEGLGQYEKALVYHQQFKLLSDSLYNAEKARIVADLQYAYETEKKNKEIQALQEEEARQKLMITIISIAAVAAVFLLIVIYLSKTLQSVRHREREAYLMAEREKAYREKYQMEAEKTIQEEKNNQLQLGLEYKNRQVVSSAMLIAQKNEVLQELNEKIKQITQLGSEPVNKGLKELSREINSNLELTDDWEHIKLHFEQVHPQFFNNLLILYPNLTVHEQKLCAYIRMKMNNKEIARLLNIAPESVKMLRYRLKKKMRLQEEENMQDTLFQL